MKNSFCAAAILPLFLFSQVLAVSNPSLIEENYGTGIDYTVVNPADSSIGTIVGFVVEASYNEYLWAVTDNGWRAQGKADLPLDATTWDSSMTVNWPEGLTWPLTWRQFFGGIDYPFGEAKCVGYFVNYSEVAPDTYKFDWAYAQDPLHLPILPGETRDDFYVFLVPTASRYLLDYMDDAQNDTFTNKGLSSFRGQTPEPATLLLFGLGGLVLRKRKA
jgi:hypothetical protein